MSEGASEHVFEGFFGNATVINLDDDDEDDEPVRMTSRRRRQISPSSASGSHTTVPRSQASPTPSTHDSSSDDEPRGPGMEMDSYGVGKLEKAHQSRQEFYLGLISAFYFIGYSILLCISTQACILEIMLRHYAMVPMDIPVLFGITSCS
ncbi:hypothetical protein CISG_04853 [Coccidioides immitis RMSCC 3703]|uniref:Uncharacterized protein n=1 Tax=Coccidioides immitis RMSCC 3703 TaxID=454286 RepID=A0A0J8QSE7_COCIT|nr:hypothetical protein CISG_04853 [Coccidioides immitis RMSCC 3703]